MPNIAYLAIRLPAASEPYVAAEIVELRGRSLGVLPCSVFRSKAAGGEFERLRAETLYFAPVRFRDLLKSLTLAIAKCRTLANITRRVLLDSKQPCLRRLRTLLHTALGVYFAALLKERSIQHIHVHHGYFASFVAMVAGRLIDIPFSLTLHGSDLLIEAAYLEMKLEQCAFCTTVSEYNRSCIIADCPSAAKNVFLRRMGVELPPRRAALPGKHAPFAILAAGRLHPIKNFDFLLRACHLLKTNEFSFQCQIAGEGGERRRLEELIGRLNLQHCVKLLGQLSPPRLSEQYWACDLCVLTSKSEGIPLVLMEAMARQRIVVAPRITGIPELITDGETGFLYEPGNIADLVRVIREVEESFEKLDSIRRAARDHVVNHFEGHKNLSSFCDLVISKLAPLSSTTSYAYPVLQ